VSDRAKMPRRVPSAKARKSWLSDSSLSFPYTTIWLYVNLVRSLLQHVFAKPVGPYENGALGGRRHKSGRFNRPLGVQKAPLRGQYSELHSRLLGMGTKMKRTELFLLGLALLSHAVLAGEAPVSVCVNALEQLEALQMVAPVYKLIGVHERQYLADADRPAEVARLKTIVAASCSAKPKHRLREESEAKQLHLVRSPECTQDRDRLSMMEKKDARTPEDDLARTRKRVLAQCPDVDLSDVWLVEWIPPLASPNG
jgi:hypothetical protein